jgi:alanine racemase
MTTTAPAISGGARVEIDLSAIEGNFRRAVRLAGHGGYAVVKADAYGHGAVPVARRLSRLDEGECRGFFVARPEEARPLLSAGAADEPRPAGGREVVVLGAFPAALPAAEGRALVEEQRELGWVPSVGSLEDLRCWRQAGSAASPVPLQLELDVGMRRTGLAAADLGPAAELLAGPEFDLRGVFGHFSESEVAGSPETAAQLERFRSALSGHPALTRSVVHLANTCGLLTPTASLDLPSVSKAQRSFRLGGGLYGLDLRPTSSQNAGLIPAMTVLSHVVQTRRVAAGEPVGYNGRYRAPSERTIGVLPLGYADGLARSTRQAEVLIGGRRCPLVGAISMDLVCVDLGTDSPARGAKAMLGELAVVLAPPPSAGASNQHAAGLSPPSIDEWSTWMGTLPYEVTCRFALRLPRTYVG